MHKYWSDYENENWVDALFCVLVGRVCFSQRRELDALSGPDWARDFK